MNVRITNPRLSRFVERQLRQRRYDSATEVVEAALALMLDRDDDHDFSPGQLARLVQEGEASGRALDGEQVFAELRQLAKRQRAKKAR